MTLQLKSVMTDLAAAAQTTLDSGRTAFSRPVEAAVPGDVVVGYPTEPIAHSQTFRRGLDRATVPLFVICGPPQDEATQTAVSAWLASGSLIEAIEAYAGTWQSVLVGPAVIQEYTTPAGVTQMALRYDIDVAA